MRSPYASGTSCFQTHEATTFAVLVLPHPPRTPSHLSSQERHKGETVERHQASGIPVASGCGELL